MKQHVILYSAYNKIKDNYLLLIIINIFQFTFRS